MSVEDVVSELRSRFERTRWDIRITEDDVRRWSAAAGAHKYPLFDRIALRLAQLFGAREESFEFCDAVVNQMRGRLYNGLVEDGGGGWPDLFCEIYEAFDAGEYSHKEKPDQDPVEAYTRPMVRAIVERRGKLDPAGAAS